MRLMFLHTSLSPCRKKSAQEECHRVQPASHATDPRRSGCPFQESDPTAPPRINSGASILLNLTWVCHSHCGTVPAPPPAGRPVALHRRPVAIQERRCCHQQASLFLIRTVKSDSFSQFVENARCAGSECAGVGSGDFSLRPNFTLKRMEVNGGRAGERSGNDSLQGLPEGPGSAIV
jgi:hypothetical protein